MRTPKNTNYQLDSFIKITRTAATTTVTSRDIRIGADRPITHEITHITKRAETDPMKTNQRLWDMARIAPIKNVLSPISMLMIIRNVFRNPDSQDSFFVAVFVSFRVICIY